MTPMYPNASVEIDTEWLLSDLVSVEERCSLLDRLFEDIRHGRVTESELPPWARRLVLGRAAD